jgi:hypothetical protein
MRNQKQRAERRRLASAGESYQVILDPQGAAQLTSDAYRQENVVSYRRRVALYAELAPLDDEINIGAGV